MKNLLLMILFLTGSLIYSQCTVNAGGSVTICDTATTLQGTAGTNNILTPTWTLVSKPAGAPDPVITGANTLTPNVTGMTFPGNYVFQISQPCTTGPPAISQTTVTAPGAVSTFTAGPDITNVNASTGTVTLNGVVPDGYTAEWSAYNIYKWERSTIKTDQNSQFSSTSTASTTFSLINKVNHDIDPAYVVTLKITSTLNPNCFYEDTAIVRFIPNPQISPQLITSKCVISGGSHFIDLLANTPIFSTGTPGSSGNADFLTTVTVNPITQPAGANISFWRLYDDRVFFNGVTAIGTYTFTVTVTNGAGTYTTPMITYNYNGISPGNVSFLVPSDPEQMMLYFTGGSGGEVHCGLAGTNTPVVFRFTLNPSDPTSLTTNVTPNGIVPPSGFPTLITVTGAGTATRTATVSAPAGGWTVGTYRFLVATGNGTCPAISQTYYIHISDASRPNVTVNDLTICYPGSGAVSATIPLPAVYKGVINSSYFQDFDVQYDFTVISKPVGSGTPSIPTRNLRLFTLNSTQIGNLTMPGEYVFRIKANPSSTSVGAFLDAEYACSATSREDTFSIFVTNAVNSNAGSDQSVVGSIATLHGNNTGVATGTWTLVSKPAGAPDPVIVSPTSPNSSITGLITAGNYTFRWTVATGVCTTSDDTVVSVTLPSPGGVPAAVWYKADAAVYSNAGTTAATDNATVQQWNDQMGTGYNLIQATAAQKPTFSNQSTLANFNPTVTFVSAGHTTGQGGFMAADPGTGNAIINRTQGSIYIAGKMNTLGGAGLAGFDTTMDFPGLHTSNTSPFDKLLFYANTANSNYATLSTNSFVAKSPFVAGSSWLNGAGSTASNLLTKIWLDGSESVYTNRANVAGTETTSRIFRIGRDSNWGSHDGQMNEAIVFANPLTASEKARIDSYLSVKWGTTLLGDYVSSSNTIVWNTTPTYQNNILGIARDNISMLYQKQSRSENADQKLIIGIGSTLANTNAANTNTLTDGQFLLTGDNGLKQSLTTPLSYTAGSNGVTNYRFESIWKVQNTNTVGTVTVAWPKGVKNLYLVQSSNEIFDGTDTFTPMTTEVTVNGVVYNTANVSLTNGQFFTFAGFDYAPGGVFSAAWYRADAATTLFSDAGATAAADNATIQQWSEFNGKPFTLAQANTAFRPQFSSTTTLVNFNPTVNYNGTEKWMQYDPVADPQGYILDRTKGALFSAGNTTNNGSLFGFGASGAGNAMDDPGLYNYTNKFLFYPVVGEFDPQSTYPINGSYIGGGTWENAAGVAGNNAVNITLDGFHQTYNTNISNVNTLATRGALMVGKADAGAQLVGQQNEMIVFANKLTDEEVNRVESYLAIKYGKTLSKEQNRNYLSSTGTVIWDGTTNNSYYNNVFGIARDNVSMMYQRQSRSVNANQKLIIGAGNTLANTNATNTNSLVEGQFLLTGDNGLKQSLTTPLPYTAGSNGTANYRFESIWKVQNTNTVGNVIVAWPKGVTNLYLVQSPDATFDGTDTFTPMTTEVTVNGVVYNTATVTLGNGQFFTFAGFVQAPGGVVGPDFWVKSDDVGTISTAWKDNSPNADNIPNLGGITLSPADRNHNFHPYTSGYTGTKFFYNAASVMNPLGNVELPNTNTSVFSAVRPTTVNGTGRIVGIDDDATYAAEPAFSIASGRPRQYEYFASVTSSDFSTAFNVGQSNIFSALANNTVANGGTSAIAGGEKRLGLNGTYESFSGFDVNNRFQIYGRNLRIGEAGWDAGAPFPGDIMEIAWYKRTLTANEQSRVNSYLAVKNGVTLNENYLSTSSAVVWDRTINTGYNNNIFGIAKDDFTALHQKQAGSVNNGQKLVISTTGFADNNAANSTNIISDLQFLMTGDNGLRQSLATPLSYTAGSNGIANYRFESIWKVQNTNNVGTVTVAWPKSVKNLYLVQSPDAVFDGTDTFTSMTTEVTVNGVVYNTVNVTLGNGQFFTFAGFGNAPGGVATGLSYWYRADKNATNTGATTDVTGWTDMWNGTAVAQLGTNALPKYVTGTSTYFNFNPGVNFTAGTQTLGNINVRTFSADSYDVFTFTKEGMTSGGAYSSIFRSLVDNALLTGSLRRWDGLGIQMDNGIERFSNTGGSTDTGVFTSPGAFSATIPSIMYHTFTANSTTRALNGAANFATTPHGGTGIRNLNGGHLFGDSQFGGNGSDNRGFVGHLGETIIYGAGNLTTTERRRVDSYLAIKYGITLGQVNTDHYLDTDGNMVWNGASNTTYNNNIFGVSRDDIEVFEQKVSKSVNNGTILTVATINDFVNPNEDATRTGFVNDKTYFLLGDNNVTVTPLVDITVAGNAWKRIQRVWLSQRKNTPDALYFEANLSTYGVNFGAGSTVWMLVADDAAFTTNVQSVAGTFTNGKWVFSNNFNADNVQRYITFAGLAPSYCVSGDCNPNTFLNTTNPNTIEYDNMVSTFHSTLMRDASTGKLMVWGERMASDGTTSVLSPREVNVANYSTLTGNVLKFTGGSNGLNIVQNVVLTTTGLFAWGQEAVVISNNLTTNATFQKLSVGTYGVNGGATKADGLPDGVAPGDVKMLFGTFNTLALTTCSGEAWVLALDTNLYGDNSGGPSTLWHRVHTNATTTLDNVVAVRGSGWRTLMALTATGEVYTWGGTTRLGNGSASAARAFATQMTLPAGVTPKMIGVTGSSNVLTTTYYILGTNGNVYALGENSRGQLGNFGTTNSNTWVQVQKSTTAGEYLTNVVWISPNEHDFQSYGNTNDYMVGSINVLTANGRLWAWGVNSSQMLGGGAATTINPTEMPGSIPSANPYDIGKLNWTDKVIAVETGGHTSMTIKDNSKKYGYVGHRINGSMGDGTSVDATENQYNFASTPEINLCGAPVLLGSCYKPGITAGTALDTKVGITALNRAGATDSDNWPMTRKGGWLALEAKTKGFVPNRVAFNASGNPIGISAANFVEGMMVYDSTNKCMKMYTSTDGGNTFAWYCISTQTCPD